MTKTFQPVILRFYVYVFIFKVPDFILMVQTQNNKANWAWSELVSYPGNFCFSPAWVLNTQ